MDYRDLLKRYIRTVIDAEGVDFIPLPNSGVFPHFSEEECRELHKLSEESMSDAHET